MLTGGEEAFERFPHNTVGPVQNPAVDAIVARGLMDVDADATVQPFLDQVGVKHESLVGRQ